MVDTPLGSYPYSDSASSWSLDYTGAIFAALLRTLRRTRTLSSFVGPSERTQTQDHKATMSESYMLSVTMDETYALLLFDYASLQ